MHHYTHIAQLKTELLDNFLQWRAEDLQNFMIKKYHPLLEGLRLFYSESNPIRKNLEYAYMHYLKDALYMLKDGRYQKMDIYNNYIVRAAELMEKAHAACHKLAEFFRSIE